MKQALDGVIRRITVGQSGAEVYELERNQIVKRVRRNGLTSPDVWIAYEREVRFYACFASAGLAFIPKVLDCSAGPDEILLVMKKYRLVSRMDLRLLLPEILETLAAIHALPIPDFLKGAQIGPQRFDAQEITGCMQGWGAVIAEHPGRFSLRALDEVAAHINALNERFFCREPKLVHGDFHFDNLLIDENGSTVVCDWQNVGIGDPSGDLSFLLNRLAADGCPIDSQAAVRHYCNCAAAAGMRMDPTDVDSRMRLSNVNTSFMFWHQYLRGAEEERVRGIFDRLLADAQCLLERE